MKKAVVISICLFVAIQVQARVLIEWGNSSSFVITSADDQNGYLPNGQSSLFQLIWTSDSTADVADATNPGSGYTSGDDIVIDSFVQTSTDTTTEYGLTSSRIWDSDNNGGTPDVPGYFYGRIFESDTVNDGDWYYQGEVTAANDIAPTGSPQAYEVTRGSTTINGGTYDGFAADEIDGTYGFQAVPEPGTMGLLALGLVTLGGAARKGRKTRA